MKKATKFYLGGCEASSENEGKGAGGKIAKVRNLLSQFDYLDQFA